MLASATKEKVALEIVSFYLQSIVKTMAFPHIATLLSLEDSENLRADLGRILAADHEPLLQHLSLTAAIYAHIYRTLKNKVALPSEVGELSPLGGIALVDLCREMEEGYYPRNRIVSLYYCEKMGASKIAEHLGVNVNTVKYHLRYLNKKYPRRKKMA